MAWFATHMLAGEALSDRWAPGGATVVAVGGQTARAVDDIGAVTSAGGHLLIQAKTRLALGRTETSELGKAIRQVVQQFVEGVPEDPSGGARRRPLDPARDRLLIVTDLDARDNIRHGLVVAAHGLGELPDSLPFDDVGNSVAVEEGRDVLLAHLRREWRRHCGADLSDAELRGVLRVLRFVVVDLRDDGSERGRALQLLRDVVAEGYTADAVWPALVAHCHELAERNLWARRERLAENVVGLRTSVVRRDSAQFQHRPSSPTPTAQRAGFGVGEGIARWTRRFHEAFNALGPARLGEPVGPLEDYGPGVAQIFTGSWLDEDWILSAMPGHLPVAVAGGVWTALEDASGGLLELGFPILDASVPAAARVIDARVLEVELAGGTRGPGKLVRPPHDAAGWRWQPAITIDMERARLSKHWPPNEDSCSLRIRAAVTLPWNQPGQAMSISPDGRSRLESRLADSSLSGAMTALCKNRGGTVVPGPWQVVLGARSQTSNWATYRAEVATKYGPALAAEVRVSGTTSMQVHPSVYADLQVEYGVWDEAQGMPRGETGLLTVKELAAVLDAAWQTASDIAPLALSPHPLQHSLTAVPTVEFHIQSCATSAKLSSGYQTPPLTDVIDFSGFGTSDFGRIPDMCVALTAPLGLPAADRLKWVRQALLYLAHAFGYVNAAESDL